MKTAFEVNMWNQLKENNFFPSIGNHGMIFINPYKKPGMYTKFFNTITEAHNHYKSYFTK